MSDIDINFGALQYANPFKAYEQGREVAIERGQQQARRDAGNLFSTDPEAAAQRLMSVGDYQGGVALRTMGRQDRSDKARTQAIDAYTKGDVPGAQAAAVGAGDFDLAEAIRNMDKGQREAARQHAEDLGGYAQSLLGEMQAGRMTPEQAKQHILQDRPRLIQMGLPGDKIDSFQPTPEALRAIVAQGMDLKTALAQADKDRTFAETQRHNRAGEGVAAGNLAVSRGNLGVRQQEFQARKKAGGFGTPGVGNVLGTQLPGAAEDWEITPSGGQ